MFSWSTKTNLFGNINKVFYKVNKTFQPKSSVHSSKRVSSEKFSSSNQNLSWNQPNAVNKTILFNKLKLFSGCNFSNKMINSENSNEV